MAMRPSEMVAWFRDLPPQGKELVSLPVVYAIAWMWFIGPAIGDATGFDTPMTTMTGYRPGITFSARTVLAFSVFVAFLLVYIYGKPRLFGHDPADYWDM